jgi:hypothetical protein
VVIFGSVRLLLKIKVTKQNFFFKKTKTGSNRPVSVWFFGQKPVQTCLVWFFSLALFFRFGSAFFRVFSGLVRFGFFSFRLIKPNRTGRFF